MKTSIYNSLEEKSKYFEQKNITTKIALDKLIAEMTDPESSHKFIFRGVNDAKFKLYNSAQRKWAEEELNYLGKSYQEFIQEEIDYAKAFQNNLLIKFFRAFGHTAYDLSILSFLQHYGAPTPLLDFSVSFDTGLFFCADKLKHAAGTDIENYFSLYAIETGQKEFISILDHIAKQFLDIEDIIIANLDKKIDYANISKKLTGLNYSYLEKLLLFYIPGYSDDGVSFSLQSRPLFKLVYNQHNLNIINQQGMFVFNSDPLLPLEGLFDGGIADNNTFFLKKIKCWNIHKSLNEYVLDYLKAQGKTHEFMYPQEEFIAEGAFKDFKKGS
jgi:hypothetical protein